MKPLTKTVARRVGGLAAQIAPADEPKPAKLAKPIVAKPKKEPFDRVAYQREFMRKRRAKERAAKAGN